jgi:hypothetical protein
MERTLKSLFAEAIPGELLKIWGGIKKVRSSVGRIFLFLGFFLKLKKIMLSFN